MFNLCLYIHNILYTYPQSDKMYKMSQKWSKAKMDKFSKITFRLFNNKIRDERLFDLSLKINSCLSIKHFLR